MIKHEWVEVGSFWPDIGLYRCNLCGEVVMWSMYANKSDLDRTYSKCKLDIINQVDEL